jgi:hypothetical protein
MKKAFNYFYKRLWIPVLVWVLRVSLWGWDWILPESLVEEGWETLSKYYGRQFNLPDRTQSVMRHLSLNQQEVLFNIAWQIREQEKQEKAKEDRLAELMEEPGTSPSEWKSLSDEFRSR